MKTTLLAGTLLASALALTPALAQSDPQHDGHHPQQQGAVASAPSSQPTAPSGRPDMAGMMGMMSRMHAGMSGCMSNATFDHIEGRIAYLRTELHIAEAQNAAWRVFADALRAQAQKSGAPAGATMEQGGLLDRIDRQERGLSSKLDGLRALKAAFTPLYTVLSDEQKKAAEGLLGSYFGMPMMSMSGMMDGGVMPGGMKPGAMPMSGMDR